MNILEEINIIVQPLNLPVETGVFTGEAPREYVVLTPLNDEYALHADNLPNYDIQEVRISLFTTSNYITLKNKLLKVLLAQEFYITDRRYLGFDGETGYHGYSIDVQKNYNMEDFNNGNDRFGQTFLCKNYGRC